MGNRIREGKLSAIGFVASCQRDQIPFRFFRVALGPLKGREIALPFFAARGLHTLSVISCKLNLAASDDSVVPLGTSDDPAATVQ
jgi:hypothetical protein